MRLQAEPPGCLAMVETETEVTVEAAVTGTEMVAVATAAVEEEGLETVVVAAGLVEVVDTVVEAAMEEVVAASRESSPAEG